MARAALAIPSNLLQFRAAQFGLISRLRLANISGMLFESAHIRVTAEYGAATLWLGFPGDPVNALDAARLNELDSALTRIETNVFINTLVVRSAKPFGFCAGLHPHVEHVTDRASFAARGQRAFARLSALPFATVAFIDGPCLGTGFELALACDYRLCVATPTTHLGFPGQFACFGGSNRLRKVVGRRADVLIESGRTFSGREARDLGLVDRAFCARRAKIELRTFLDELECAPRVPEREIDETGFAQERRAFAALKSLSTNATISIPSDTDTLLARGFITPLEAEQARARTASAPAPASTTGEPARPVRRAA
ncbi:fatty acid oxidation complex subunit alpha (includes: enoyl- hydratase 3-hydroxybutyryl- epimerase 3-hydroxyacyl- dehydrogenase) : 3-hydroxybutyryl-CoA epimerase OS=Planctomyces brasiliensis (strain ATCC 49424 / DSM 5305 / JCM 21570 / NBRC 103401 / IFAM 1448) GN=Plabr_2886 PE=3 SV=1: ECH [Gemmata massiliana]|uniref:Fatty acid oxidation complex subunit alpha n=2 Tax=Gemmata massiliana TaxID=1210884 RepID=A0A6P2DHB4_9BACT|nr:fatty acid oxidation complex subunit alpha (includes: enoyl- hydratase 3-hydroxybutyryl- epimerase 3-hydroxyacyl- dehydrogenase) : 3-hydroxybutyryl-CoA epimerase OS=Planctomyces brasiliensis (strain ATCC 49424 / DSM 5305 / JCM 21570 / NBRC 103401 / IFAM 1448) GN=Plabr_2886 PE=3 SV=1: ECH [Gemmata massiliana]